MYLNIKMQTLKLGIRQNDVARALGIDESVLSKIIHGYREPSKAQREQLAGFLKAEESWLFEIYECAVRNVGALPDRFAGAEKESKSVAASDQPSRTAGPARLAALKPGDECSRAPVRGDLAGDYRTSRDSGPGE